MDQEHMDWLLKDGPTPEFIKAEIDAEVQRELDLEDLENVLLDDVQLWYHEVACGARQAHRRTFVRSVIAYVEGSSFALREDLLHDSDGIQNLEPVEHAVLKNEKYELQKDGQVRLLPSKGYPSTAPMLLFTLRMCAKANKVTVEIRTDQSGWCAMAETFQLRDDLTHPKRIQALQVTDDQITQCIRAFNWYVSCRATLFYEIFKASTEGLERLHTENPAIARPPLINSMKSLLSPFHARITKDRLPEDWKTDPPEGK